MNSTTINQKRRLIAPVLLKNVGGVIVLAGMSVLIAGCGAEEHVEATRNAAAEALGNEQPKPIDDERTEPSMDDKIAALIETIDEDVDMLHSDYTPSVHKLIAIGEPAIEPLLELMVDDSRYSKFTRMHAETALYVILCGMHGFVPGKGWLNPDGEQDPEAEQRFLALWHTLGELQWDMPLSTRKQNVQKWREWLANGAPINHPISSSLGSGEHANE